MTAQPRDQQQRSPPRRRRAGPQAGFRRSHSAPLRHAAYARASAMCATGEELRALSGEQREQRAATRMPESDQGSAGSLSAGLCWAAGQFAAGRWSATESARPKGAAKGRAPRAARHLWDFVTLPMGGASPAAHAMDLSGDDDEDTFSRSGGSSALAFPLAGGALTLAAPH